MLVPANRIQLRVAAVDDAPAFATALREQLGLRLADDVMIYAYRNCRDERVVADVVRLDKGHTEGLEPNVTKTLVKLMLAARGGRIQHGG